MSKKYRLIKEYPGSPKLLNFILDETWEIKNSPTHVTHCINGLSLNPENYPEFWELVVEKDYEILIFISIFNNNIRYKKDSQLKNTYCSIDGKAPFHSLEDMLIAESVKIHSVKRLSDGEIFTVGDEINFNIHSLSKPIDIIKEIYLLHDVLRFKSTNFKWNNELKNIGKLKQSLFTTEDDVDIFEGDTFYHTSGWTEPKTVVAKSKHLNYSLPMDKLYSTKEKAEEYILYNKPCLSLNDIENIIYENSTLDRRSKLKNLVKTKLQQK